jgi:hypothetical protein
MRAYSFDGMKWSTFTLSLLHGGRQMSRRTRGHEDRAALTRNGIVAGDLLASDANPPTRAREIDQDRTAEYAEILERERPAEQTNEANTEEAIARALVMAQRMANQTVEEAKVKARSMITEAEARAKNMTEQAHMRAREVTEAAQMRAREVTEAAQMRAREVTEAAQARARELTEGLETRYKERIQSAEARARVAEEQARMQIAQAAEQVARRRQELQNSIDALAAFERDYRARLRDFVEAQLQSMDQEVNAMDREVKAIDQQVKAIEGSMDAPPSPELIAASLEALKTLVLNYATLVRSFAQGHRNTLEHTVPIGSLAPQQPVPPAEADGDPSST